MTEGRLTEGRSRMKEGLMLRALTLITMCATAVPAFAQPAAPQGPPVIVTTGEGSVKLAPDRAWVTIAAETRDKSPQAAQAANAQAVITQIKAAGVPADGIQTSGYALQPEFDYANGKRTLRDYVARNSVQVRVDTLAKLGEILAAAVGTGATNVSGVRFDLKNRDAAERQALTEAVRDARARADAIASGGGVQIDRVLRIEEHRQPVVNPALEMAAQQPLMREVLAAQPAVPIESGQLEIRAQVTLTAVIR
jgi:hypothetical protein